MINPFNKMLKTFFLILLAVTSTLSATQGTCRELTLKTGYFVFSNSKLRKVYDRGGWDIQLCAATPICKLTRRWTLHAYGAVEYFHRSGQSIHGNQKTSLWSVPINLGLKPVWKINENSHYYFTIGPRFFYINQHNSFKNRSKNGFGLFVNTGINYYLCKHFLIDIFGEYSYAKTHFHDRNPRVYTRNIQIGGFTFGGGIGYAF